MIDPTKNESPGRDPEAPAPESTPTPDHSSSSSGERTPTDEEVIAGLLSAIGDDDDPRDRIVDLDEVTRAKWATLCRFKNRWPYDSRDVTVREIEPAAHVLHDRFKMSEHGLSSVLFGDTAQIINALYACERHDPNIDPASVVLSIPGLAPTFGTKHVLQSEAPLPSQNDDGSLYGIDARDFLAKDYGEEAWIVRGLVPEGAPCVLLGQPKQGKSWFELYLAICIATGRSAFGLPTTRSKVLVISREDRERETKRRMSLLMRGLGVSPDELAGWLWVDCVQPMYLDREDTLAKLDRTMKAIKPRIVFVDSLSRVHTQNENDRSEMAKVTNAWNDLCVTHSASMMILHHCSKHGEGPLLHRARGTGDIAALVRMGIGIERTKDGVIEIETDGNLPDMVTDLKIRLVDVRGAGAPALDLKVVSGGVAPVAPVDYADPDVTRVLENLMSKSYAYDPKLKLYRIKTTDAYKGMSKDRGPELLDRLVADGVLRPVTAGKKYMGYTLTKKGEEMVGLRTEPARTIEFDPVADLAMIAGVAIKAG